MKSFFSFLSKWDNKETGWWVVGTGLTGGGEGFELGSETSGGTLESPRGEYGTTLARGKLS
jgi:hypothetical protein